MCLKGKISYSSPSNIAIIKYWGKEPGDQIPMNPSLSMTLDTCRSFTAVEYEVRKGSEPFIEVIFEGKRAIEIEAKLQRWFTKISYFFSWLNYTSLKINSHNNFPHSAGIASSASGMSTMAMCLCAIDAHVNNGAMPDLNLQSNISRLGSGSASRSVMGPWVIWGETELFPDASNDYAVVVPDVHNDFLNLNDTIVVVDKEPKRISSRDGHTFMELHPWRKGRIDQVKQNMPLLLKALSQGDWTLFQRVTENEALSLHGLMLASEGGIMLWRGNTIEWMHYLRDQRKKTGTPLTFTLDAGANLHVLYPQSAANDVHKILNESPVPSLEIIHDKTGTGPEKLMDEYEHC
jgi:diphosphomevalonate decarboxylase